MNMITLLHSIPHMRAHSFLRAAFVLGASFLLASTASAQIGRRFPSEKKVVPDPVTGIPLTFLTSTPARDSKIYQTHPQWTSDGKWVIFRSNRVPGQAMAVNEDNGTIVQVTEGGFMGMLCVARLSMKLYVMREPNAPARRGPDAGEPPVGEPPRPAVSASVSPGGPGAADATPVPGAPPVRPGAPGAPGGGSNRPHGPFQIVEVDLAKLFADSEAGLLKAANVYERVCGTIPAEMGAGGDMALDANEDVAYFRLQNPDLASRLPAGTKIAEPFGPRGMGAGPAGLAGMNLKTGEIKFIVVVPFQIGHVQTNPWMPGEIVFCWETGGKASQRTWTVMADGTGLRPLYPEASYEWITHEAVITRDEVAIAILAMHRRPGMGDNAVSPWGPAGSPEHPTGVGIVNLRTREMRIVGQVPVGDPGSSIWHVNGSADGRWAVADDFQYRLWLIDRHTGQMALLADLGHKAPTREKQGAADHIHPTFSADGTKIEVETAMLSPDEPASAGKPASLNMNICVVPVPKSWLARTYTATIEP
jgi:oligogalacturonide lyase